MTDHKIDLLEYCKTIPCLFTGMKRKPPFTICQILQSITKLRIYAQFRHCKIKMTHLKWWPEGLHVVKLTYLSYRKTEVSWANEIHWFLDFKSFRQICTENLFKFISITSVFFSIWPCWMTWRLENPGSGNWKEFYVAESSAFQQKEPQSSNRLCVKETWIPHVSHKKHLYKIMLVRFSADS